MVYVQKKDIKFPKRKEDSHKGDNGRILIVGGSEEYTGAVLLAAMAALRSGADIVTIAAPEKVAWALNCLSPDLITVKFKGERFLEKHVKEVAELASSFDVVLLGNGMARDESTMRFVKKLVPMLKQKLVVDADALKALGSPNIPVKNAILTPHSGELQSLLDNAGMGCALLGEPEKDAHSLRDAFLPLLREGNVLLFKGKADIIVSEKQSALNETGNAGMTVGGTGDVLAGLCAGFASQMDSIFDAACAAAFINGALGDELKKTKGNGYIASDLIELLPNYLKEF